MAMGASTLGDSNAVWKHLTTASRVALDIAWDSAVARGTPHVTCDDIVIGVIGVPGAAVAMLEKNVTAVRQEIDKVRYELPVAERAWVDRTFDAPSSAGLEKALAEAGEEKFLGGPPKIRTDHLLSAMLESCSPEVVAIMFGAGVTSDSLRSYRQEQREQVLIRSIFQRFRADEPSWVVRMVIHMVERVYLMVAELKEREQHRSKRG